MSQTIIRSGGVGFGGMLTIVLLVLKVTGYANISWLWVFAPIWIPFLIALLIMGGVLLATVIAALMG